MITNVLPPFFMVHSVLVVDSTIVGYISGLCCMSFCLCVIFVKQMSYVSVLDHNWSSLVLY